MPAPPPIRYERRNSAPPNTGSLSARITRAPLRPAVRFDRRAGFELNQRRRLLRPSRDDAARAMVLEAARDEPDAIGQQGGSERVAGMALIFMPIKPEVENPAAVDIAADLQAEG